MGYFGLSQSASEKLWLMLQMLVRKCELSLHVNLKRITRCKKLKKCQTLRKII